MNKKVYVEDVEPLIDKHRGNVTSVAKELGVSRRTVHRRINESVTLQKKLEDARETMLDNAESVLYNAVLAGKTAELIFFLKTQGKNRGYTERQEVTGKDGDRMQTLNIDVSNLTDDQLERIAAGEDPLDVIRSTASAG